MEKENIINWIMSKSLDIKIYYDFLIKIGKSYQSELKDLDFAIKKYGLNGKKQ